MPAELIAVKINVRLLAAICPQQSSDADRLLLGPEKCWAREEMLIFMCTYGCF
jgi:hypothetical protein